MVQDDERVMSILANVLQRQPEERGRYMRMACEDPTT
jgi:hypothetical protein